MNSNQNTTSEQEPQKSYLQQRVFEGIGLSEQDNLITLKYTGRWGMSSEYEAKIFSSDEHDNIRILVYDLDRNVIEYDDPNPPKTAAHSDLERVKTYYVTRRNPKNIPEGDDAKYLFPKGQGIYPFIPPRLLVKFEKQEEVPMLVLTEGYFKAMCASLHGFDIIGLSSITHYADSKAKKLHRDIRRIIDVCKVKTVVILYDGDCLNISLKDLQRREELTRRPQVFYNALIHTRELLLNEDVEIFFAHINSDELKNHPKGLDDLLLDEAYKDKSKEILEDLEYLGKGGTYFHKINLKAHVGKLQAYFNLKTVNMFYNAWQEIIKDQPFVYFGSTYQYNSKDNILVRTVPRELKNYICVGDDYFEKIWIPSIRGGEDHKEFRLAPRQKGTIKDDFGSASLAHIPKFKAFINYPSHTNYQDIIDNCFNLYSPLNYQPFKGQWEHIDFMLHHIFGGDSEESDQYQLGLDYMQLLYQQPTQMLPILCLVSQERGTGKTSFLDLLREIFGANAITVGNSEIMSEFNALISGKLIVGVDETSLDDNTKVTERLKMMSTAKKSPVQKKGKDHVEVENFTKYILCSNNETRFIYTQQDEIRFWVRRIPKIPDDKLVPNILELLYDEIPGFLYFLNNRKLFVREAKSRMWFSADDIKTKALERLQLNQRPAVVKEIETELKTLFLSFPAMEYTFSVKILKEMIDEIRHTSNDYIRSLLRDYFGAKDTVNEKGISKVSYIKIPYMLGEQISYRTDKNRGFIIKADTVLTPSELAEMKAMLPTDNVPPQDTQGVLDFQNKEDDQPW